MPDADGGTWSVNAVPEMVVYDADGIEVVRWFYGRWVGALANRAELARRADVNINSAGAVARACLHVAEQIGGTACPVAHRVAGV